MMNSCVAQYIYLQIIRSNSHYIHITLISYIGSMQNVFLIIFYCRKQFELTREPRATKARYRRSNSVA